MIVTCVYDAITKTQTQSNNLYAKVIEIPFFMDELLYSNTRQFTVRVYCHDSRGVFRLKEYGVGIYRSTIGQESISIGDFTPNNVGPKFVGVIEDGVCSFYVSGFKDLCVKVQMIQCDNKNLYTFIQGSYFDTNLSGKVVYEPVVATDIPYYIHDNNKKIFFGRNVNGGWGTTAIGFDAGRESTSSNSLFIGTDVGKTAQGTNIVGVGIGALRDLTTGADITAVGRQALLQLTTGNNNSAFGTMSLYSLLTGNNNNAFGRAALFALADGSDNIGIGNAAGRHYQSASGNKSNTSSNRSIYIGNETKASAVNADNEIVIGYNAVGKGSNKVQLGNSSVTEGFIGNNRIVQSVAVPATPTSPGKKGDIAGDANYIYYCYSENSWIRIPKDSTWV